MLAIALLWGLLLVTTATDLRYRKIYNWSTYPGMLAALVLGGVVTALRMSADGQPAELANWISRVDLAESALGLLACGAVMLVCYVFFAGGIGGGDVKLIAMLGAFLGVQQGLEAMLWTFLIGGCVALISLIWRVGAIHLVRHAGRWVWYSIRGGGALPLSDEERRPLKAQLYLSPSALAGVLIVEWRVLEWF